MIVKNLAKIFVPEFLDEQFFVAALEEGLRETKIQLQEIDFAWGSVPGENYCSSIYRVVIAFQRLSVPLGEDEPRRCVNGDGGVERISLIVKVLPVSKETQFLQDAAVFLKEKVTYLDVLPRMEVLSQNDRFGAKLFYATKSPVQTMVFSDLGVDGYRTASRQDCLDWNHASLILQKLAKFHATSLVLAEKDPAIVERYREGMLSDTTVLKSDTYENMFGDLLDFLIVESRSWPDFQRITGHLERFRANFRPIASKLAQPKPGDRITVLNHSDTWTNNFMFAYDDPAQPDRPTRALFVDFQMSFYGSPGCDINLLLNTSVQLDVLADRREKLVELYYEAFASTLRHMRHHSVPTLDDVRYEVRARELYGFFFLFAFVPVVTMPKELSQDSSIEALNDPEFKRVKFAKVFAQPKLQKHLQHGLRRLEQMGVLDEF